MIVAFLTWLRRRFATKPIPSGWTIDPRFHIPTRRLTADELNEPARTWNTESSRRGWFDRNSF